HVEPVGGQALLGVGEAGAGRLAGGSGDRLAGEPGRAAELARVAAEALVGDVGEAGIAAAVIVALAKRAQQLGRRRRAAPGKQRDKQRGPHHFTYGTPMALRFSVGDDEDGLTLAAVVRRRRPELAWSRARRLVARGKVSIAGEVCLDEARRLRAGEEV